MSKNLLVKVETKQKPWGYEVWFAHTDQYAGKILHVNKGRRLSLQYHEKKMETQYVLNGKIKMIYGPNEKNLKSKILKSGDCFHIPPRMLHRIWALEESELFEVSTPELADVVKLADDYGRTGKGNNEKLDIMLARKQTSVRKPMRFNLKKTLPVQL